jgi:hypothetical protein
VELAHERRNVRLGLRGLTPLVVDSFGQKYSRRKKESMETVEPISG